MQNGYFRLVNDSEGFGIALYRPTGYGEELQIGEITEYLEDMRIGYDRRWIEKQLDVEEDVVCHLGPDDCPVCPETYHLEESSDGMTVTVRFYPPSETGERMTLNGFLQDLQLRNITRGVQMNVLQEHFQSDGSYCTDIIVAKGKEPVEGTDARIEYFFDTDMHRRPAQKDDGRVDYFNLSTINHCHKGEMLARIIPEVRGEMGYDVYGREKKPREVKRGVLKFGRNIVMSEDKLSISSTVDGHVALQDEKVIVSAVYMVQNVDVSTGNISYEGSVEIAGNVSENFEVKAGGNVVVNGLVEGAKITAGGNIIIGKGMNGMGGKGYLRAGGDVIVKFLENVRVVTGGYVETEAILHCRVSAGSEVRVDGRKGLIVGGYVQAANKVMAKTIGGSMGVATILEVGVNPLIKSQYTRMQKQLADTTKTVKDAEVILENFKDKLKKGFKYNESQLKYMKSITTLVEDKSVEIEQITMRLEKLRTMMEIQKMAEVVINDQVFPGTTIIIGDASKTIQSNFHYCKFIKEMGEVRMAPL